MAQNKNDLKTAFEDLEKIINDLSRKDIDVDSGLEKFKAGAELIKSCRSQLKEAENEFKKLKDSLEMEDIEDEE